VVDHSPSNHWVRVVPAAAAVRKEFRYVSLRGPRWADDVRAICATVKHERETQVGWELRASFAPVTQYEEHVPFGSQVAARPNLWEDTPEYLVGLVARSRQKNREAIRAVDTDAEAPTSNSSGTALYPLSEGERFRHGRNSHAADVKHADGV